MSKIYFVHIPKNGGMTIRHSSILKNKILYAKKNMLISPGYLNSLKATMKSTGDHHGIPHARYRDVHPAFTQNGSFAIVRNPWSRVVSRYLFAKQSIDNGASPKNYANVTSLENFIEERHIWGNKPYMWHRAIRGWYPQYEYVINNDNNVICDILRLEFLNIDICKYFNILEMTEPRNVTTIKFDYKTLYNNKTIQIIADWYKTDIDFWGFDFDTSAQKNYWNSK